MNFHELGLNKAILRTLQEIGHIEPTPIQAQAIPAVLEGQDVVGLAQTGTGKTAAFLLPLLQRQIRDNHKGKYRPLRVLVLSPTRELAAQIYEKARDYGKSLNLRSQCAVGGIPISRQQKALQRGCDFLIATPGRLLDLAKRNAISLDKVEAVVLDEADHMFDIGFFPDIRRILAQLPMHRQTLLFSATMPKPILELAEQYLHEPVEVSVARESTVAENIDQHVHHILARQKPDALASILQENHGKKVVVFARTKHGSDKIVKRLQSIGIDSAAIHGNKSQGQRERALKAFTRGDCPVLIATDIAARGIDIKDVGIVVNYDLPEVPEVYVHRIGRTARAGSSGLAVAFCAPDETKKLRAIEKLIKMDIPFVGEAAEVKEDGGSKTGKRRFKKRGSNGRPSAKKRGIVKPKRKNPSQSKDEASNQNEHSRPDKTRSEQRGEKNKRPPRNRRSSDVSGERSETRSPVDTESKNKDRAKAKKRRPQTDRNRSDGRGPRSKEGNESGKRESSNSRGKPKGKRPFNRNRNRSSDKK